MIKSFQNTTHCGNANPLLSVLVPYYHDDPSDLLDDLWAELHNGLPTYEDSNPVEILLYDDGGNDRLVNQKLVAAAKNNTVPTRLFFASENKGRSCARNYLKSKAKAPWVLFLDADMRPADDKFLEKYLVEIKNDDADIIFGGFTVPSEKQSSATELHRVFSKTSDCLSAEKRAQNGAQYVCSSNLCVRAKILDAEPFDTGFTGWGWEDSEWAARVAKIYKLKHADNPALHLGLETTETLLERFKNSGANYNRFTSLHPELAQTLTLYKLSKRLKHWPGQNLLRFFLKILVLSTLIPTKLRLLALKLWRASWYSETVI